MARLSFNADNLQESTRDLLKPGKYLAEIIPAYPLINVALDFITTAVGSLNIGGPYELVNTLNST